MYTDYLLKASSSICGQHGENEVSTKAEIKKQESITQLAAVRRNIINVASSLLPEKQEEVFLGVWSIKDLLAHLVGWDFANIEAMHAIRAGQLPGFYAHHDPDWRTFNSQLVAQFRQDDFRAMLSSVADSHQQLVALLETIPAHEFDKDYGVRFKGYKVTITRTVQAEAKDEEKHFAQIQEFAEVYPQEGNES